MAAVTPNKETARPVETLARTHLSATEAAMRRYPR
jgi:hypothetical protein